MGPFRGLRDHFEGPRGPFKGPRGSLKGLRGPLKGPRGPFKGHWRPSTGDRRPVTVDRRPSTGDFKRTRGPLKGPVFLGFSPEIDPGPPLDRPDAPRTSSCTKNQPRRPILRQFRGNSGVWGGGWGGVDRLRGRSERVGIGGVSMGIIPVRPKLGVRQPCGHTVMA